MIASTRPSSGLPSVTPDAPVEVRFLGAGDAGALVEAIQRSYGATYDVSWLYDVGEIRRRLEGGVMTSVAGFDPTGDVVGHVGLLRDAPDSVVGEAGQAVVDPRYRGHHLFTTLKRTMAGWCTEQGILGMYSEATAAHPYSQTANLALGAHETGFLLGYIPASVSYREIAEDERSRRQSVALFWLGTNPVPPREIHPPARHREILAAVYSHNALERRLAASRHLPHRSTRLVVRERVDHNESTIAIQAVGDDVTEVLGRALAEQAGRGRDVVYVELRLDDPATAALPAAVHDELGVFFGGVVPERRDGDVLVLQWLNGVEADPSDVAVASEFGRELLDYVFLRKAS